MKIPAGRTTNWIGAVTFVAFLAQWLTGTIDGAALGFGFIPARLTALLGGGAVVPDSAWIAPAWLTPVTTTFVHASWLHIGFNLLMLLFVGRHIEQVLGCRPMLLLYAIGAYAACLAQWLVDPASLSPMVGASGAISAWVATYALLYSQQDVKRIGPLSPGIVRLLWLAAAWIGLQLLIGLASGGGAGGDIGRIAIAAHIGGFVAGLALTRPLLRWRFRRARRWVG
jgi:membrane associated rhomboid family serine protease